MTKQIATFLCAAALMAAAAAVPSAQVGKSQGVADLNTMPETAVAALPGVTPAIAKAVVAKRPFASITELNAFLLSQKMSQDQAKLANCMAQNAQKHEKEIAALGERAKAASEANDMPKTMAIADTIMRIQMAGCGK